MQMPTINMETLLCKTWYKIGEEIVGALWGDHHEKDHNKIKFGLVDLMLFPLLPMLFLDIGRVGLVMLGIILGDRPRIVRYVVTSIPLFLLGATALAVTIVMGCLEAIRTLTVFALSLALTLPTLFFVPALRLGYQAGVKLQPFYSQGNRESSKEVDKLYGNNFTWRTIFPALNA